MKKILAILMATVLVLSLCACGGKGPTTSIKDPAELLNNVWAKFGENEVFMAYGGDGGEDGMSFAENAAGAYSLTNAEALESQFAFPAAEVAKLESAATMIHGMMVNFYAAAAYKVADHNNTDALVTSIKDGLASMRWMCGQPDKYVIYTVDDLYIVSVYGNTMNVDNFKTHIVEAYPQAKLVVEEAIA
ncbi:MAG: hypothetical protein IJ946_01465 [Clostridia bacterium]|nr:hypothetical protein [Clostridia bacterium]